MIVAVEAPINVSCNKQTTANRGSNARKVSESFSFRSNNIANDRCFAPKASQRKLKNCAGAP